MLNAHCAGKLKIGKELFKIGDINIQYILQVAFYDRKMANLTNLFIRCILRWKGGEISLISGIISTAFRIIC